MRIKDEGGYTVQEHFGRSEIANPRRSWKEEMPININK